MARPKNTSPSRSFEVSVPADAYACLEFMSRIGRFGGTPSGVARYLLLREIDDLTRQSVLPKEPIT